MKKHLTLLFVILFVSLATISQIYAQEDQLPCECETNPCVYTYDGIPTQICDTFDIGSNIGIIAYSVNTPYNIKVYDPDGGDPVWTDTSDQPLYDSGLVGGLTNKLGEWRVEAGPASSGFAVALYHVIPGMPLGVMAVLSACFAGLGTKRLLRRK